MTDDKDEEQEPTRQQLQAAFPEKSFSDGGVSHDQLTAAHPESIDADGDHVAIPEDELKDLSALEATDDPALHGVRPGERRR